MDEKKVSVTEDEFRLKVEEKFEQIRTQSMLLGAQTMLNVILQKMYAKPSKKSYRDYERLFADIENFCLTGLSKKVNEDGTTSEAEEVNADE